MEEFNRDYDDDSGLFNVEVWRVPEGLDLSVTLPSAERIPCRYDNEGNLESSLIARIQASGVHGTLVMMKTTPMSLSPKVREIALRAVSEYLRLC